LNIMLLANNNPSPRSPVPNPLLKIIQNKIFYIAAILIASILVSFILLRFLPYPQLRDFQTRPFSVRYYDRYGILLQITPVGEGLRREKAREIPRSVKDVFVFAEDKRFFSHIGVDFFSVFRALYQNTAGGRRVSGASTITMQLARLINDASSTTAEYRPPRRQTINQKIAEAFNALRLEARFSKNEILQMYLESLPFGFGAEGAASAARTFFSCELDTLSPAQIFCLAVIPRRPGFYNPLDYKENCLAAASELQSKFAANKRLARKYPLFAQIDGHDWSFALSSARRFQYPFELPHLIRIIDSENRRPASGEMRLSIDIDLQNYLEDKIAGNVTMYYSSRITNGASIVIDNETGEILAWVGSADFFDEDAAGQIDGVLALNQPGSSMKPFLYAMALEKGFYPSGVIADVPMTFGESEIYIPQNFNNRFNGPVLFRAALASSLNIPAVYLLYRLGVRNYTQLLLSLGFDSVENSAGDAGLGLALGNAPVSLFELARAFSVFPRDGIYMPLTWEMSDNGAERSMNRNKRKVNNGSITNNAVRIFAEDTSRLVCSFLSDSSARVLAFGMGRNFRTTFPAIFKTGTSNQYQNIAALGATMKYTVGVWMGNFTGETVLDKTGSSVPAAIVRDTLNVLHRTNYADTQLDFPVPGEWNVRRICAVSGMDPSNACLFIINEYVHPDEERRACSWHRIVNGRSETTYPAEYQSWFNSSVRYGSLDYSSSPLEILNPRGGFVYLSSPALQNDEIPVEVIGGGSGVLHVTHNGVSFNVNRPFTFFLPRVRGSNSLYVRSGGEEQTVNFSVE